MLRSFLSTRTGTFVVAGVIAIAAAAVLLVYVEQYRNSVNRGSQQVTVLVANRLIPQNTPGNAMGAGHYYVERTFPEDQVKDGAITDPATLQGQVATDDILPGQQLVASEFEAKPDAIAYKLTGDQRAISVPLDAAHGMIGDIRTGDHVDVLGGFNVIPIDKNGVPLNGGSGARPVLRTLMSNVLVLSAPASSSSGFGSGSTQQKQVVLRVDNQQAAELAFSSDNGKVWLIDRPQTGASATPPSFVTLETLLLGIKPITVIHGFGGKS